MTLKEYLRVKNCSANAFAALIGVTPESVRRYRRGVRQPRAEIVARIFRASGGAVTPQDWYEGLMGNLRVDGRRPAARSTR